jgi:hypothetical protein
MRISPEERLLATAGPERDASLEFALADVALSPAVNKDELSGRRWSCPWLAAYAGASVMGVVILLSPTQ